MNTSIMNTTTRERASILATNKMIRNTYMLLADLSALFLEIPGLSLAVSSMFVLLVAGMTRQDTDIMMGKGRQVLSAIPGVREVLTGHAVKEDAKYRHTWLVHFCHPAVIDSYRENPVHADFADKLFRPVAAERISIDYQVIETLSTQKNNSEQSFREEDVQMVNA